MSPDRLESSRRWFLRALGATGAFLPLLDFERRARAAGKGPTRFVSWLWPNGVSDEYWPSGSTGPLGTLTETLSPLEPHKKDIVVVDNMYLAVMHDQVPDFGGHPSPNWLMTGSPCHLGKYGGEDLAVGNSQTLDLTIADAMAKARPTRFRSLVTGVDNREETSAAYKYFTFSGPAIGQSPNAPAVDDNVVKMYMKLFGDGTPVQGDALAKVVAERKSVLDYTGRALERFGKTLGTESKALIDQHLAGIRAIENQMAAMPTNVKGPTVDPNFNSYDKKAYDKIGKAQLDLVIAALAAGQTNVASLMWSNGHNNSWVFYWLGSDFTVPITGGFGPVLGHHDIAHQGGSATGSGLNARRKRAVDQWFHSQLAYLIAELKKRGIFDDTLIWFTNNMGNGASHTIHRVPMILAGGGGAIPTGRLVRSGGDVPHNKLLVSIAQAFGLPMTTFGSSVYQGPLPGLAA